MNASCPSLLIRYWLDHAWPACYCACSRKIETFSKTGKTNSSLPCALIVLVIPAPFIGKALNGTVARFGDFCTEMVSLKLPVAESFTSSGTPTLSDCSCESV